MATVATELFISIDAGQGGGAKTVDAICELEGNLFEDIKAGVPFNPAGKERLTNLPGKIQAGNAGTFRYVPADTQDTANNLYGDLIDAYNLRTEITIVVRISDAVKSVTNPQWTLKGYIMRNPATFSDGGKIESVVAPSLNSVQFDDGTTDITWD